jgi:DNA helicase-2/ATP-dependent DNA helicase PcrA
VRRSCPPAAGRRRPEGTTQQEAFWAALTGGDAHVELSARAGTGKSFSCREGIWRLLEADPMAAPIYVAFNRAIAAEFQAGLPPGARAATMHAMGFAAIRAAVPGVGEPAKFKMWDIVDTLLPRRDRRTRSVKAAVVRLADLCKGHLIDPLGPTGRADLDRLAAGHGIVVDSRDREQAYNLVPMVLRKCREQTAVVCFSDMPWLPVVLGLDFPPCDVLFIDESQDLDACQHALVRRIAGEGRVVMVGDPHQAIYNFRGADSRSMATLAGQLRETARGLVTLPLTMTRRCPRSHVALARNVVADFEALPTAPGGRVDADADPDSCLEPGVMALCRTNAPLVSAAYALVGANVPVAIQGKDLGEGLARFIEGFAADSLAGLLRGVELHRAAEADRLAALENSGGEIEALDDRCGCVIAASRGCASVGELTRKVAALFLEVSPANQGRYVLLSSVHRAKGREADRVAILRPDLMPHAMARTPEAVVQERNLAYVAATRSKHRLAFLGAIPPILKGA